MGRCFLDDEDVFVMDVVVVVVAVWNVIVVYEGLGCKRAKV